MEIKTKINVENTEVTIIRKGNEEFISLTDLARYTNSEDPKIPILTWLRSKAVISFLGLWEKINNKNFDVTEFSKIENETGSNKFYMSPKKWIELTKAIGMTSKSGNNGGTFAHSDIAFEFASWLSPEFKLYLITEFKRLKNNEAYQNQISWSAKRELSKTNYLIHTNSIKKYIVPTLTDKQKQFVYANEADVLNVALFGITAKEWRDKNSELLGNIRDYADVIELIVLINLENLNANMIAQGLSQNKRLEELNKIAKEQMELLKDSKNIKKIDNIITEQKLLNE